MEDVLLNIWDTPSDSNTPSPFELMFHRKVKSDLPSIPLSLFDSTNSINAGHRSVKHADRANERENRGELLRLEQNPTIMFMKKRQEKKARWSCRTVVSVDGQQSYTIEQPEHNIPETGSTSSQFPDMSLLHLRQKFLRKGGKKVHQCQWKYQTPRLWLVYQSQSQRPPWSSKLITHQIMSKHPEQGISLKHQ